jgi:hypothetical protein
LAAAGSLIGACLTASASWAATDLALGMPVTGTAYYNNGDVFPYSNLTDGRLGDTGSSYDWSFWLTPDGYGGAAAIDLGSDYSISSFYIQNTLNRGYQDRAAHHLDVYLSTSAPALGNVGTYGTKVQAIDFPDTLGTYVITDDAFAITPTVGRFITVDMTSFYGYSGGLNEVEAFGSPASPAVPEPATWTLAIIGLGGIGAAMRRRRAGLASA